MEKTEFQIVAQDPGMHDDRGRVVTAVIKLPKEQLAKGPMGYALQVVDYDATTGTMYRPARTTEPVTVPTSMEALLADPGYHAMNAYAIVMRTLLRFEFALGRRVGWGIRGHQLKIVPHAFEEANSFYSPDLEALLFGYVRDSPPMFLCLSHDVVVHEATHALLDGLRGKFKAPSSPDQSALHEAFADIVALLSVFALPEVLRHLVRRFGDGRDDFVAKSALTWQALADSALFGLADNMRADASGLRVNALRRSVTIEPDPNILRSLEFQEEHRRGEVLVGAVMRTFLGAWVARIQRLGGEDPDALVDLGRAAEDGADIADLLLTMAIRAIDYTPPIHIEFADFLSAMLTADAEVRADDSRYELRQHLRQTMASFGIPPGSRQADGCWTQNGGMLQRDGSHFGSLQTDPTEVFRHIWRNRDLLGLDENAFTRIASVRPCSRVSPDDGFQVRETVVECVQWLGITAAELPDYGLTVPRGMPLEQDVVLEAGSTLVLDEYGDLKFNITNGLPSAASNRGRARWNRRIQYLWDQGYLTGGNRSARVAAFHLERALADPDGALVEHEARLRRDEEGWNR
jgi:hypothetical protein